MSADIGYQGRVPKRLRMPIITLTTDFGQRDHYVACLKGVIMQIAPAAAIVDVTHEIERHNILHGAFVLRQVMSWYTAGTIHVVVVDPGVGTPRRIIAARYAGQYVVAPDNGLISFVHHELPVENVHVVENPRLGLPHVSHTFHGRDIIGPAAAHLAGKAKLSDLGPATDHVEVIQVAQPRLLAGHIVQGRIIYSDVFGNLVTNISHEDLASVYRQRPDAGVFLDDTDIGPVRNTYADVPAGKPLALVGSSGLLEISVNAGSAKERLKPQADSVVEVK